VVVEQLVDRLLHLLVDAVTHTVKLLRLHLVRRGRTALLHLRVHLLLRNVLLLLHVRPRSVVKGAAL
jgi:hypothetical protein